MGNTLIEDQNKADYDGFSLVSGGLIYKMTSVFRGKSNDKKGIRLTAIVLALITWVPVCILAIANGTMVDDDTTISFFEDFLFHVRYLFVVPFLILVENMINQSFVAYIKNSDYLVPDNQQDEFNKLVAQLNKMTNSYLPEIIALIVIYTLIYVNWDSLSIFDSGRNYLFFKGTKSLNSAGWYYLLVCSPILQMLIFRWIWRWIVWAYSMIKISRFKLKTDSLHADQMAGLAYINLSALDFSYLLLAPSAIMAAVIGVEIIYHAADLKSYFLPISLYLIIMPVLVYGPLLSFIPFLRKAKSYGIRQFGNLIRKHNIDYAEKWIDNDPPKGEKLLDSADHSSLADINGSYGPVQGLKLLPLNTKMILLSFVFTALPFVPLIFTRYSVADLFNLLTSSILGG